MAVMVGSRRATAVVAAAEAMAAIRKFHNFNQNFPRRILGPNSARPCRISDWAPLCLNKDDFFGTAFNQTVGRAAAAAVGGAR